MRSVSSSGNEPLCAGLLHYPATRKSKAPIGVEEAKSHTRAGVNSDVFKCDIRASLTNHKWVGAVKVVSRHNLFPVQQLIEIWGKKRLRRDHSYIARSIDLGPAQRPSQVLDVIGSNGLE